ncbi:MAG: hypothetical protein IJZ30_01040 [Alphaproteobacteria bacterium]|nr:hypothetical protein [Alphaproteobacteria bacterium]
MMEKNRFFGACFFCVRKRRDCFVAMLLAMMEERGWKGLTILKGSPKEGAG